MGILSAIGGIVGGVGSYLGGKKQAEASRQNAQDNIAYQKEFAQKGIQWKTQDAKEAGLHPLAALGAQTQSFSPVSVGDQGAPYKGISQGVMNAASLLESQARAKKDEALAQFYASQAKTEQQRSNVTQDSGVTVGSIENEFFDPGVPMNEPVGTQRTYNLNIDSDVQNWEDKYGDLVGGTVGITKLGKDYGQQLGLRTQITPKAKGYRVRNGKLQKLIGKSKLSGGIWVDVRNTDWDIKRGYINRH